MVQVIAKLTPFFGAEQYKTRPLFWCRGILLTEIKKVFLSL